jgi:hypothetical protein
VRLLTNRIPQRERDAPDSPHHPIGDLDGWVGPQRSLDGSPEQGIGLTIDACLVNTVDVLAACKAVFGLEST